MQKKSFSVNFQSISIEGEVLQTNPEGFLFEIAI